VPASLEKVQIVSAGGVMLSDTPEPTHIVKYLRTELLDPTCRGRSFHLAPLSRIQKMPRRA
jgi:hypothetical protein